ncbi:MAG: hypothetical protein JW860_11495 [Sedimentisphaerales bacterium]|nr:hypothetical protein [Sedimentisphaerales bacterium]
MSLISNVNNSLVQSQLESLKLRSDIDTKLAAKSLDIARDQGEAVLTLLDAAADLAKEANASQGSNITWGTIVSGLGQNIDVHA